MRMSCLGCMARATLHIHKSTDDGDPIFTLVDFNTTEYHAKFLKHNQATIMAEVLRVKMMRGVESQLMIPVGNC